MLQDARPVGTRVAGPVQDASPCTAAAAGAGGMSRLECRVKSALAGSLGVKRGSRRCPRSRRFSPCPRLWFPFELVERRSGPNTNPASLETAQTAASPRLQPQPELRMGKRDLCFHAFLAISGVFP